MQHGARRGQRRSKGQTWKKLELCLALRTSSNDWGFENVFLVTAWRTSLKGPEQVQGDKLGSC